jgi:hypothetical protein
MAVVRIAVVVVVHTAGAVHTAAVVVVGPIDLAVVNMVVVDVKPVHRAVGWGVAHIEAALDGATEDMEKTFGLVVEERVCCNLTGLEDKVKMRRTGVDFESEKRESEVVLEN